jgi:hypothetical protein
MDKESLNMVKQNQDASASLRDDSQHQLHEDTIDLTKSVSPFFNKASLCSSSSAYLNL